MNDRAAIKAQFQAAGNLDGLIGLGRFDLRFVTVRVEERDTAMERKDFINSWYRVVTSASPGMTSRQSP
jgi:hypothetical protein